MARMELLRFDGETIPKPDSYEVGLQDVEADSGGETEAGTTQRDIIRTGVASIPLSFSVSPKWLHKLTAYKQKASIHVHYFDPESGEMKGAEMYITDFKAKLVKDTTKKGLWSVTFTLKEF